MTVRLKIFGNTDWADGDILTGSDQSETITKAATEPWYEVIQNEGSTVQRGLIAFGTSGSIWQTRNELTTDSGGSWVSQGYYDEAALAVANGSGGISQKTGGNTGLKYTLTNGSPWFDAAVDAGSYGTAGVRDMALNGSVGIMTGNANGGPGFGWYSHDTGSTWAQISGPGVITHGVTMSSSSVGYLCDNSQNIWKTTDGGVNWTDTADNLSVNMAKAVSSGTDVVYWTDGDSMVLQEYVNSTNTVNTIATVGGASSLTNPVIATNGNVYAVSTGTDSQVTLLKYDGSKVFTKIVTVKSPSFVSDNTFVNNLIHHDNVLYLNLSGFIVKIELGDK
jgi:hypothetical protein